MYVSQSSSPSPEPPTRGWTTAQEHQVLRLRDHDKKPWAEVSSSMKRSVSACQGHYYIMTRAREGALVEWTELLDHRLIDGRRRGLDMKIISEEISIPTHAVQDRWATLLRRHQVPKDVIAMWRRKEEVVWTTVEDEKILGLYLQGHSDEEISKLLKFKNKSKDDMRARRVELVMGSSPLYLKMLGMVGSKETPKTGLEKAMGKKKYSWM
ncbi:hypothetical protein CC86DRAFT_405697 [Ophiobolus disseminans]|uniref:Myb-like domain-containing protein n=1 Tax=Ophiobolus disseminans TaxID=1469910 RepID=A0A6A7A4H3_9PLEO|nr:hypothetical protein CC86DRAFT_405697 [Ophiobolus disseminans]